MANLDTATGLTTPTMAEIIAAFVAQINANIDPTFAINDDNLLAQIIVILSQELSDLFDTLQFCFDVLDPSTAQGLNLDDSAKWVGLTRKSALSTKVYLLMTAASTTTVPVNTTLTAEDFNISNIRAFIIHQSACAQAIIGILSAVDSQHYTIELDDIEIDYIAVPSDTPATIATALVGLILSGAPLFTAVINPDDDTQIIINRTTGGIIDYSQAFALVVNTPTYIGVVSFSAFGPFYNSITGNISIPAGTFDLMSTPVSGVTTLQPDDGILGQDVENDQNLRIRRDLSLAFGGNRTIAAIRAALIKLDYVQKAVVFQNTANVSDIIYNAITLLPHSIYAVLLGGYKTDIGTEIYDRMSEGIQTNGQTAVDIVDENNNTILIYFDYATQISIAINITITIDKNILYKVDKNVTQNVLTAISDYILSLNIGETMYVETIKGLATCAVQYGVKSIVLTYAILPGSTPLSVDLTPSSNAIVVANEANINVTVVTE